MRVLFIVNECNPEWASVPLLGYFFFDALSKLVDITLVTHERNKQALEKVRGERDIHYVNENPSISTYYKYLNRYVFSRWNNWPLHHVLSYPLYAEFNHKVYKRFSREVSRGDYDIVHTMTPILPRYPYKIIKACKKTPFILGPVNGGLPFPKNFDHIAKKEAAQFNFLRFFSKLLPLYKDTYKKADKVLVGSSHTFELLEKMFSIRTPSLDLFCENGVSSEFFLKKKTIHNIHDQKHLHLLFVGRLVPYKGADMILSAISKLNSNRREKIYLTIVGSGPEKSKLQHQVTLLNLQKNVHFTGWISHQQTLSYYQKADIFCFPSVREFGGAVVLEAMASGLPSIVINHGGIAEYVDEKSGIKINPMSKEYIVDELKNSIKLLMDDEKLRIQMGKNAIVRAMEYEWSNKAKKLVQVYKDLTK